MKLYLFVVLMLGSFGLSAKALAVDFKCQTEANKSLNLSVTADGKSIRFVRDTSVFELKQKTDDKSRYVGVSDDEPTFAKLVVVDEDSETSNLYIAILFSTKSGRGQFQSTIASYICIK